MRIRIGYAHPDRLLSYPDVRFLSGCVWVAGATTSYAGGTALSLVAQWCHAPGLVLRGVWERACAWFLGNVARNSPVTTSKLEIIALELQRFEQFSKNDRGKLCATFVWRGQAIPL